MQLLRTIFACLFCVVACAARNAPAQSPFSSGPEPAADIKPKYLERIGITQKLGQSVPGDLVFKDETGAPVKLSQYFDGRHPVILTLVYFNCPQLCTLVLNDQTRMMNAMNWSAGEEFICLSVSFDPGDTPTLAGKKKKNYVGTYQRPLAEQGWHFLTGDAEAIARLTDAVGFRYEWDDKFKQFAHPSGITILTPQGTISKYFFGIEYGARDVKLALQEAADNKVGTITDKIMLYCFHYDAKSGRYTMRIVRLLQVAGTLTLAGLGAFWFTMFRREKHSRDVTKIES